MPFSLLGLKMDDFHKLV